MLKTPFQLNFFDAQDLKHNKCIIILQLVFQISMKSELHKLSNQLRALLLKKLKKRGNKPFKPQNAQQNKNKDIEFMNKTIKHMDSYLLHNKYL